MISLFIFLDYLWFFVFSIFWVFIIINNFSWMGVFFVVDSYSFIILIVISLFILGIVLLREKNEILLILSELLVLVCILFFIPSSILILYIFFELSLVPILIIILGYGLQIEKINSAYYLIFYASFCSLPFLYVYFMGGWNIFVYFDNFLSWELVFILSLSFMMKFPVYFLHLWLPKAHVEAPTTARMLLAGLLLKLGTAGFLRILGCFNFLHGNIWLIIAFLGMIIARICCIFQSDAKSLAAYSSVTHMSFLLMALVFVVITGKTSRIILILAHGYTSTLIFYLVGEFFHVTRSRMIYYLRGFLSSRIIIAILFAVIFLSNRGTPPSLSFISEFVVISSMLLSINFSFWILFIYFFIAFYYSIYLLTRGFMGKRYLDFNIWNIGFSVPIVIIIYNILWVGVFF